MAWCNAWHSGFVRFKIIFFWQFNILNIFSTVIEIEYSLSLFAVAPLPSMNAQRKKASLVFISFEMCLCCPKAFHQSDDPNTQWYKEYES
jgi:hypothetical protein